MVKTEEELFAALDALDEAERALRAQRMALEADCRAFGELEGARGFRLDHLRIRHNVRLVRQRASEEQAA